MSRRFRPRVACANSRSSACVTSEARPVRRPALRRRPFGDPVATAMTFFYLLLGLAVLLLASAALAVWRLWRRQTLMPYRLEDGLFAPAEADLLAALDVAAGPGRRIFGKVLVEDVIGLERRVGRQLQARASARLAERRFDFLICDARTLRVLCAVDLVGDERRLFGARADATLARICRAAGLPLVTVTAAERYDPRELAEALAAAMAPPPAEVPTRLDKPQRPPEEGPPSQDEDRLLAELAAAIRHENTD
ncbi:hypothetical protein CKO22_11630 [Thiococcus pfennigii]|nr:hypothetical protein [Thiococcus pfennigii]